MVRALLGSLASAVALASCYSPTIADCSIGCEATTGECPDGLQCNSNNGCVADLSNTCSPRASAEAGVPADAKGSGSGSGSGSDVCTAPTSPSTGSGAITCSAMVIAGVPCVLACTNGVSNVDATEYASSGWSILQHIATTEDATIDAAAGSGTWIGLHRSGSGSSDFEWADKSAVGSATAWKAGEPNPDGANFPCVVATTAGWVASACAGPTPYFIEHP